MADFEKQSAMEDIYEKKEKSALVGMLRLRKCFGVVPCSIYFVCLDKLFKAGNMDQEL